MGRIVIDNLDEALVRRIELQADAAGRSFDEEVRAILEQAVKPASARSDRGARAAAIRAMTPKGVEQTDSTQMIREMRDRGYADY
jgi:plasmid stability protein